VPCARNGRKHAQTDANGYFDVNIPLKMLLGFFEDYNKIVVDAKHELIIRRADTDNYAIIQTEAEEFKISLIKVEWLLPHVRVADHTQIPVLNRTKADKTLAHSGAGARFSWPKV